MEMTEQDKANVKVASAEARLKQAYMLESLTRSGFTHASAVEAVTTDDWSLLTSV